ncbi:MAG: tRNA uridine-5-carboxymethylaminomethyl(34) synthesis GTPase MnmE [Acidaminococcaceae bacterium]|nr:tRNA uridine-5-carboxymethylaminomethyl(34) synthesis GTPase MnmE [Acidaminococcaceae bacterium]
MDTNSNFSDNTIVAIATALGEGAVGIVRLSGDNALPVANKILSKPLSKDKPKCLQYCHVLSGNTVVDEVLAVYMPAPHSYTGENVVEIQCHGGVAALQKILTLCLQNGARMAEPGEFTKRAFLNGRIDLTQAEAVMDIIRAKSETALQMALRTQQGELSAKIKKLRGNLVDIIVNLEAKIDYPEDDIEDVTYSDTQKNITETKDVLEQLLATGHTGKILREGLRVAIVGRPNVGKSSLLNALLEEERAIVSAYAGTTRDVIEEQILLNGVPVILSDTAGIHDTDNYVEKIGVERSRSTLETAQLVLCVLDSSVALTEEDRELLKVLHPQNTLLVLNKNDLPLQIEKDELKGFQLFNISSKTKDGLNELKTAMQKYAYSGTQGDSGVFVQNVRHLDLLQKAVAALQNALETIDNKMPYDCVIIDLQNAISNLGEITGEQVTDEIINKIFAKFCVGK